MSASNHAALAGFLKRLLMRSHLSADEQDAVLSLKSQAFQVAARRDLVFPGQTVEYSCLVGDGLVGRFDQMRDGRRQITAFHIAGDMCDLHSVVAPTTGWGITALSTCLVYHVAHDDLRRAATSHPNLAMAFWRDTTVDASILAKWVANVGRKDAQSRIAHLMCEMGVRMERAGLASHVSYPLPVNQEQIGDAMGLTSVHVNRTLQSLKRSGAVSFQKHHVEIHDWDELVSIADFVPTFMLFDERRKNDAA